MDTDSIINEKVDLTTLIAKNNFPFFAYFYNSETVQSHNNSNNIINNQGADASLKSNEDIIFLYKSVDIKCILAKCYSSMLQDYLIHHRPSYVPTDTFTPQTTLNQGTYLTQNTNNTTSSSFLFNDVIAVPYNYHGLFEIFSSATIKSGGILDHIKDVVSLASRLKKPKFYYVAKELKVIELQTRGSKNQSFNKKLIKIGAGSVIKAMQVVSVDYDDTHSNNYNAVSFLDFFNDVFCCRYRKKKKKLEVCVEMRLIENFDELTYTQKISQIDHYDSDLEDYVKIDFDQFDTDNKYPRANPIDKTYYLPLYDGSEYSEIDLIPISLLFKSLYNTNLLKTNSLQTVKNFILNDRLVEENYLELKLFDENPFHKHKTHNQNNHLNLIAHKLTHSHFSLHKESHPAALSNMNEIKAQFLKEDQHLELNKYTSIFDVVDFKTKCTFLIGYSLRSKQYFLMPKDKIRKIDLTSLSKSGCVYKRLSNIDIDQNLFVTKFKQDKMENFIKFVDYEMDNFNLNLHKIVLSPCNHEDPIMSHANLNTYENVKEKIFPAITETSIAMSTNQHQPAKRLISHFADLANVDDESVSENIRMKNLNSNNSNNFSNAVLSQIKNSGKSFKKNQLKYNTLPNKPHRKSFENIFYLDNLHDDTESDKKSNENLNVIMHAHTNFIDVEADEKISENSGEISTNNNIIKKSMTRPKLAQRVVTLSTKHNRSNSMPNKVTRSFHRDKIKTFS
jgi:hypothetical protein